MMNPDSKAVAFEDLVEFDELYEFFLNGEDKPEDEEPKNNGPRIEKIADEVSDFAKNGASYGLMDLKADIER